MLGLFRAKKILQKLLSIEITLMPLMPLTTSAGGDRITATGVGRGIDGDAV